MKLRHQLFLISLITLLIPWAGSLFIKELEQTLRHNQLGHLSQQAQLIATQLEQHTTVPATAINNYNPIYGFTLPSPIILDGYFDDWRSARQQPVSAEAESSDIQTRYLAGVHGDRFYLYIEVTTPNIRYRDPSKKTLTHSDHLRLKSYSADGRVIDSIASPIAPGRLDLFTRRETGYFSRDASLRGHWQDTKQGYQIELEIPLYIAKRGLGFSIEKSVHPTQASSNREPPWSGTTPPDERSDLPAVIIRLPSLEEKLTPFAGQNTRISLVNQDKWVIAQVGHIDQEQYSTAWQQGEYESLARDILLAVFKAALSESRPTPLRQSAPGQRDSVAIDSALTNRPSTGWFYEPQSNQAIIAAAHPLTLGTLSTVTSDSPTNTPITQQHITVLVEQATDAIASLSDKALARLIAISFSVVLLIVLVLLGFAFLLSWRVAGLRNKIDQSINEDGRVSTPFKPSGMSDELGDLSRSFATMHEEVASYTGYLESFSRKLSHELKTPLAIVRSSIENLSMEEHTTPASTFLQRADEGAQRLSQILNAMSEATRLEKSIENTEHETFNLTEVVSSAGEAFQSLLKNHNVTLDIKHSTRLMRGSPDLIAQLIDKLVDNARDFTPNNGAISISLENQGDDYLLKIINEGPLLPELMQRDIFNAFVSLRADNQNEGHMGQGLVIVRLITDYHQGQVTARNLADGCGVCFEVRLPSLLSKSKLQRT